MSSESNSDNVPDWLNSEEEEVKKPVNTKDFFAQQQLKDKQEKMERDKQAKENNTTNSASDKMTKNNKVELNKKQDTKPPKEKKIKIGDDIPCDMLETYINKLNSIGFGEEFFSLEVKSDVHFYTDFSNATKNVNQVKNRYTNILALDKTRFKLDTQNIANEETDYVNANYVDGTNKSDYIASQGPLECTTTDFWKMVWQAKCNVVVMLTKLVERVYEKCFRYWPSEVNESLKCGPLTLKFTNELVNGGIVVRKFLLKKDKEERLIYQYQYKEWPDHGLPASAKVFRHLLKLVNNTHDKKGPILVHCSAGIGRTGTFCTIHKISKKLHEHFKNKPNEVPSINIFKTVLEFRNFRVGMVQTKEQYEFCYRAVLEEYQYLKQKTNKKQINNNLDEEVNSKEDINTDNNDK